MQNRREFVKEVVAGAAVLGASSPLSLAAAKPAAEKSKVVIVRDAKLRTTGTTPDPVRVAALLDHAMQSYFGTKNPIDPWRLIVRPGQTVGLKVNCLGRALSPNVALVAAICERLQQAGIKPGDITVWDRSSRDMQAAGFKLSSTPGAVRYIASDAPGVGYEDSPTVYGTVTTHLAKLLTGSDVMINLPVLKNHNLAGVTMSMKNMYGVINNPNALHGSACNPYIADLNMIPHIRQKMKFIIGDMMTAVYEGGPTYNPSYAWNENGLIVGEDRVAIDHTCAGIVERKRAEKGLPTLAQKGTPTHYIETAADTNHQLGTNDPARISLMEHSIA
ncbi:MAG: DUF362 domain-containing protein [Acidobacteriaceae bacterium]|nr:DUF362 domain-containing protein [Acidobacteriaceae bacterium]